MNKVKRWLQPEEPDFLLTWRRNVGSNGINERCQFMGNVPVAGREEANSELCQKEEVADSIILSWRTCTSCEESKPRKKKTEKTNNR